MFGEKTLEPKVYSEEEMNTVDEYIENKFGAFDNVMHEIYSPDIHVDICIIPPARNRQFYTLVTMGMGAHVMNVPDEVKKAGYDRAELLINLPADWDLGSDEEKYYWAVRWLKILARMPIEEDSWIGWGHTVSNVGFEPFAEDTGFCGFLLTDPMAWGQDESFCILPGGDRVNFFQIIPLYREEVEYKMDNGANKLLKLLNALYAPEHTVDVFRQNVCEAYIPHDMVLDHAERHLEKIWEKHLPIDEINAYNHMAIYLRWCIKKSLVSKEFVRENKDTVWGVIRGNKTDLRGFIRNDLSGILSKKIMTQEGADFSDYYYNEENGYTWNVDDHALEYFGEERYNSEEFQDEAYMFVPFDEDYYKAMEKYADAAYEMWRRVMDTSFDSGSGIFS